MRLRAASCLVVVLLTIAELCQHCHSFTKRFKAPGLPHDRPPRVLFVGNSFTYGPPPYDRTNQSQLNNLPRLFELVANSLGHNVHVAEDTIGGCR